MGRTKERRKKERERATKQVRTCAPGKEMEKKKKKTKKTKPLHPGKSPTPVRRQPRQRNNTGILEENTAISVKPLKMETVLYKQSMSLPCFPQP